MALVASDRPSSVQVHLLAALAVWRLAWTRPHPPLRGDLRRITLFGVLCGVLRVQVTLPARATLYGDRGRPERRNPGGGARRFGLRNQMIWSGCTLQPLAVGPNINYNEMIIKRQAYNE